MLDNNKTPHQEMDGDDDNLACVQAAMAALEIEDRDAEYDAEEGNEESSNESHGNDGGVEVSNTLTESGRSEQTENEDDVEEDRRRDEVAYNKEIGLNMKARYKKKWQGEVEDGDYYDSSSSGDRKARAKKHDS